MQKHLSTRPATALASDVESVGVPSGEYLSQYTGLYGRSSMGQTNEPNIQDVPANMGQFIHSRHLRKW